VTAILVFFTSSWGKYAAIALGVLALAAAGYGALRLHDARVLAEDHARQMATQAAADAVTYQRNIAALQQAADAAQARAAALASTHQRIADAPATACAAAPAAIRAAILHPGTGDPAAAHP
jgi:hypothetical protein